MTAEFHVKLLKPTPTDGPVTLRAKVVESSEKKAVVTSTCRGVFVAAKEGHPAYHRW